MIVHADEAVSKNFLGVDLVVLASGEKSMITKMIYKAEDQIPFHKHPHEQSGYVLSGKFKLFYGDKIEMINPGDSYSIPSNVEHKIEIISPGEILDFFTPLRQDYL